VSNYKEARSLEWQRKVDARLHPSMTAAQRKEAVRAAAGNKTIFRMSMFWQAMEVLLADDGPEASGWAATAWHDTKEGPARVLHLKGRKRIRKGWRVPTMLADATLNVDLVRPFWPNVELVADVAVETPHQHIRQITDRSNSKRHLELHDELTEDERRIRTRHLRSVNATIAAIGRAYLPGKTLAVTQKAIRETLPTIGVLPPSIDLAWHNAIAGLDKWKHVSALVVVGRTAPSPAAVSRMAEALTGAAVQPLPGWYPKVTTTRAMTNGDPVQAECDRHPDAICEAIRWQINEGELVQIIGRARGVNRTQADPVDIWVLTDAALPLALDETLSSADLDPGPMELMLGTDGVALENASDASRAYPELWSTLDAARQALLRAKRGRYATFPYNKTIYTLSTREPEKPKR